MADDDLNEHYFLWFSDVHYDPYYATSQAFKSSFYKDVNCDSVDTQPLGQYGCDSPTALVHSALEYAVNITSTKEPTFIIISGDSVRHGVDLLFTGGDFNEGGEARYNDKNSSNSAVEHAAHSSWHKQAMETAGDIVNELVSMVQITFPNSEIIVSLGNNDVVPDYYLQLFEDGNDDEDVSFTETTLTPEDSGMLGVLFNALTSTGSSHSNDNTTSTTSTRLLGEQSDNETIMEPILIASDQSTFLRGGYYSRQIHNGAITILSINTVLYSSNFGPQPNNVDDPGHQFKWMRAVLSNCRELGTQAIIVGHIAPCVGSFRHTQLWQTQYIQTYYDIVQEYDEVITGQLFGHIHTDEFRVGLDTSTASSSSNDISMIPQLSTPILLGPSITPLHGNDPAMRLVKYGGRSSNSGSESDTLQYQLLDYDSHSFTSGSTHQWSKLYTFSEAYGIIASDIIKEEGLSSKVFQTILQSMEDNKGKESPVLELYRSYMISGASIEGNNRGVNDKCNVQCRNELVCTFQSATRSGYETCLSGRSQWKQRSIVGIVAVLGFILVFASFAIVRLRKKRNMRKNYESTPSVVGLSDNNDADIRDQEMI